MWSDVIVQFQINYIWLWNENTFAKKFICFHKVHEQTEDYVIWLSRRDRREIKTKYLFLYMYEKANLKHKAVLLIHFTCITITFKTRYNLLCGVRQEKT